MAAALSGAALNAAPPAAALNATPAISSATVAPAQPALMAPAAAEIPALTSVKLEIREQLVSKVSKAGAFFPLRLAEPILVNGAIAVPAGAEGVGEVVESKGGGMSGSPGVLILAARYLTVDGRRVRLRSMHIVQTGTNNQDGAMAVGVLFGFPGLFITGGKTIVAVGTVAEAKTAEPFVLTAATATTTITTTNPQIAAAPSSAITKEGNAK